MFLKPNLYTCGYRPSIALDLTLEGELRARFGSGAVTCFYCCALKYIFSFLPGALCLSGSLNSVSHSVWATKMFWFFSEFCIALLNAFEDHPAGDLTGDVHTSDTHMSGFRLGSQPTLLLPSLLDAADDWLKWNRCISPAQHLAGGNLLFLRFMFLPSIT